MESVADILDRWLDETFSVVEAEGIRSHIHCFVPGCEDAPTHFDSSGDGFCGFHFDHNQSEHQGDLAA